jgi:hypothetical protein
MQWGAPLRNLIKNQYTDYLTLHDYNLQHGVHAGGILYHCEWKKKIYKIQINRKFFVLKNNIQIYIQFVRALHSIYRYHIKKSEAFYARLDKQVQTSQLYINNFLEQIYHSK